MLKEIIEISCPGDTLKDELEFRKIDFNEFEKKIELEEGELQLIFEGKKKIKESLAKKLETELEIPFSFWLKLEDNYIQDIKEEMKKLLVLYCKDNKGVIDLSELDFGNEVLKLEGIKAKVINNSKQQAVFVNNANQLSGKISNFEQEAGVIINNIGQSARHEIHNKDQKAKKISNLNQTAKEKIDNQGQKAKMEIDNSEQNSENEIFNYNQRAKEKIHNHCQRAKQIDNGNQLANKSIYNNNQASLKIHN